MWALTCTRSCVFHFDTLSDSYHSTFSELLTIVSCCCVCAFLRSTSAPSCGSSQTETKLTFFPIRVRVLHVRPVTAAKWWTPNLFFPDHLCSRFLFVAFFLSRWRKKPVEFYSAEKRAAFGRYIVDSCTGFAISLEETTSGKKVEFCFL